MTADPRKADPPAEGTTRSLADDDIKRVGGIRPGDTSSDEPGKPVDKSPADQDGSPSSEAGGVD